ncbi:L-lactate dehydrogenase [Brevundimonas diminuta]|uniref:L-lactate dehydrogenase n=1 Tax=Brevundimonas diminuta TaxID=293 RepID=UPI0030FD1A90
MKPVSISDYRQAARRRLPRFLFEYIDGGSYSETTLKRNVADLEALAVRQRVLRNVSVIDTSATLFGAKAALPLALAPVGLSGLYGRRGEVQAARAAAASGVPFTLSTVSACSIEEVAAGASAPFWFQLYMIRDRAFMADLLARADEAGCSALVFTVDMPMPGARYRDYRSGLAGAPGLGGDLRRIFQAVQRPAWAWNVGLHGRPHTLGNVAPVLEGRSGIEDFFAWMGENFDPGVTWDDLDWVRTRWRKPMIIKGVLDPDDARQALDLGADGIVVSNHGGRQLDGALSTARALPAIAAAVDRRMPILADGGVRSGLDILRMLALGADGVMIGRAWAYALSAGGSAGVSRMLDMLKAEFRVAMGLAGVAAVSDIDVSLLA